MGNSLAIRVQRSVVDELQLEEGAALELRV